MTQNRFWFDVRNYINMVHDEFLMTEEFQTKEAIWNAFWDGTQGKNNGRYTNYPPLMKAWQKGNRFRQTVTITHDGVKTDDYLQDLSAAWGRWSKRRPSIIHGQSLEIGLYDGSTITGHWVLAEDGAATASHWPFAHYREQDGFPCRQDSGRTMATKNYAADLLAQKECGRMARNFDERAITEGPMVVSFDGIVMTGNLRTMAGQLAARWESDGAYIDYLRNHCEVWGFKQEDVNRYEHPRLFFMLKRTPLHQYSPEEFKRFASL